MRKRSGNPYARQFSASSRRRRSAAAEETIRKHLRRRFLAGESANLDDLRREIGVSYKLAQRCFEEEATKAEQHLLDTFVTRARRFWEKSSGGSYRALASARGASDHAMALALAHVIPAGDPRTLQRDEDGRTPRDIAFSAEMARALQALEPDDEPSPPSLSLEETDGWLEHVQRFAALVYRCPLPERSRWTIKPAERTHRKTGERRLCFELVHADDGSRVQLSRAIEYLARLLDGASLAGIPAPHPEIAFLATWLAAIRRLVADCGEHVLVGVKPSIARHLLSPLPPAPAPAKTPCSPAPAPKPRRPTRTTTEQGWWTHYSVRTNGRAISPGTLMSPTGYASLATCGQPAS
ncbi:hypothetical protein [Medusavirus stheno T3]|uniref:Uncharacterized protein n=1 Tax=Medusavirus stheno T3 TaxID=3069717 RepID=A0A7S7YFP2_9VIRU|nr:hypothetical protein QKU73_gp094 [Acanthamoeba castellanii medusavirus]QPB44275.1 hypothetical protein [Medusavirus stheno T3]